MTMEGRMKEAAGRRAMCVEVEESEWKGVETARGAEVEIRKAQTELQWRGREDRSKGQSEATMAAGERDQPLSRPLPPPPSSASADSRR